MGKFLRLSSAQVKICKIPHVNFETTSKFLFKFCIILHSHDLYDSSVNSKLIHFLFWIKETHESLNFETFNHSSVSGKITPLYFFRSNIIYFAQKEPIKAEIVRILGAQVKVLVIFETTNQIFFKFCITLQFHNA